jgi:hypothetical protein
VRLALALILLIAGCSTGPTRDATAAPPVQPTTRAIRKVELNDLAVWRYDPAADRWVRVTGEILRLVLFEPVSPTADPATTKPLRANPIGLYWAAWTQDGVPRGTLIFRGPVQCNDIKLGEPPAGKVPACVPSEHSATAQFVPDPRLFCK